MKYFHIHIIILSLLILFFTFSGKQDDKNVISFKTEIYNFGTVSEGEQVSYAFVFTNKGKETINIENVRPACGCTLMGEYDREVKPGESGEINVQLNTSGYQGEITKTITVTTNIPGKEKIILSLRGNVHTPIIVKPKNLWLGKVRKDELSLSGDFTILNNSETPLKILEVLPLNEKTNTLLTTVTDQKEYKLKVTILPPFQDSRVDEYIIVKTNNPSKEKLTLRYTYDVQSEIFVYPQIVTIDPGPLEKKTEKSIRIESNFSEPISIFYPQFTGIQLAYTIKEETKGKLFVITFLFPEKFELKEKDICVFSFQVKRGERMNTFNIPVRIQ